MGNFPKVIFRDSDHSYWIGKGSLESGDRSRLVSVNKLWSTYCKPFNSELNQHMKAYEYFKKSKRVWIKHFANNNKTLDDFYSTYGDAHGSEFEDYLEIVKYEWYLSSELGTKFHNDREDEAYSSGEFLNPFNNKVYPVVPKSLDKWDNYSVTEDLWEIEDGAHMELVVWDEKAGVCGQIDVCIVETIDGIRYFYIYDFKTNGGLTQEDGEKKRGELVKPRKDNRMSDPLSHLWDNTKTKYQGQVSLYAQILERAGFVAKDLGIGHYLNFDNSTGLTIPMDYLQEEASVVLKNNSIKK